MKMKMVTVRETTKDTDALAQYKTMRNLFSTHLNYEDIELAMLDRLFLSGDVQITEYN